MEAVECTHSGMPEHNPSTEVGTVSVLEQQSDSLHATAHLSIETSTPLIALDISKIVTLFTIGSIVGLIIEIIFHFCVFGVYENRFGLVWGPFSPLYGVGAVCLTIVINRLWQQRGIVIFIISAIIGSAVEYGCSWWMEHFFGAIAWDYSGTFLNIDGRVNLMFALMWGTLGLVWARLAMPAMKRAFDHVNWKSVALRSSTVFLSLFLVINIVLTVQAFGRESDRVNGLPAASSYDVFLDEMFPSHWMQDRFANMSIYGARTN